MLSATLLAIIPAVFPEVDSIHQENRVRDLFQTIARRTASPGERHAAFAELTDLREFELEQLTPYLNHKKPEIRAEAVFARIINDASNGERFASQVLREADLALEVQVAAIRGLAWHHSDFGRVLTLRQLEKTEGASLIECLKYLEFDASAADIPYLIRVLERAPSGLAEARLVSMLQSLTGYKMGNDAKAWRYWMRYHQASGTPFFREEAPEEKEDWTVNYLGLPIFGKDVVFVIDSSGSMLIPMEERGPGTRGDVAVKELSQLLPRLPNDGSFGVVCFANEARYLSRTMLDRDSDSLSKADRWIRSRNFEGGTNLFAGIMRGLEFSGAEELVLLSDGEPSVGERNVYEIAKAVENANRWRNIRISAVGIGVAPSQRKLLARITKQNDGDLILLR